MEERNRESFYGEMNEWKHCEERREGRGGEGRDPDQERITPLPPVVCGSQSHASQPRFVLIVGDIAALPLLCNTSDGETERRTSNTV